LRQPPADFTPQSTREDLGELATGKCRASDLVPIRGTACAIARRRRASAGNVDQKEVVRQLWRATLSATQAHTKALRPKEDSSGSD